MSIARNAAMVGGTTYNRFCRLLDKGPIVLCSRLGTEFYFENTNPDDKGGRISKEYDDFIHDQTVEQSKFKKGPGWQRGIL